LQPDSTILPIASEAAAAARLERFLEAAVGRYAAQRDLPAVEGTSRISQDLRFGLLSIRNVYARVAERLRELGPEKGGSVQIYINELCWREFYFQVLWHAPHVLEQEYGVGYRGLPWTHDPAALERWCQGQTGFPIVDAGMRQLLATGFMHNRVRMITAMFLTKDLHQDWRAGEQWFMQRLLDGEIASNNGGWQWSAGTGTDAAPYFRIQNPWTQSERFDPQSAYIKHWVPELRDVPAVRLHQPPSPGLRFHREYPLPMVEHGRERLASLQIYKDHLAKTR
jgi:deoxyribodipyrimidine photo-lyase